MPLCVVDDDRLTELSLSALFIAAFLAATPIPFQSEVVFIGLQTAGQTPIWQLIVVASLANTLGSVVTYYAGRGVSGRFAERWLHIKPETLTKAERVFGRWGPICLLLSWAPGGDLLVAVSGALRLSLWKFLPVVAIAKTGRYIVVALATDQALDLLSRAG